MSALILLGIGFIGGGIVGIVISCLCTASRNSFDEDEYFEEKDKGEW